jgi:hypothetical protein
VGSAPAERSNDGVERNGIAAGDLSLGSRPGPDRARTRTRGYSGGGGVAPSLSSEAARRALGIGIWDLATGRWLEMANV